MALFFKLLELVKFARIVELVKFAKTPKIVELQETREKTSFFDLPDDLRIIIWRRARFASARDSVERVYVTNHQ